MAVIDPNKPYQTTSTPTPTTPAYGAPKTPQNLQEWGTMAQKLGHNDVLGLNNYINSDAGKAAMQKGGYANASDYLQNKMGGVQRTDDINNAFQLRQQSELDAIRRQRDQALQGLNKVETGVKQQSYDNRNSADVTSMQNAQRLRQSMSDMGLLSSGDNLTAQAQGNAQRQGAIGSINRDESNALTDVNERRGFINNNAAAEETALIQRLQAEQMMKQLEQQRYDQQFDYGRGRDAVGDKQWQDQFDYGKGRDTIGDQWRDKEWQYGMSRDEIEDRLRREQFEYGKSRDAVGDSQWQQQFGYGQSRDAIGDQFNRDQLDWNKIIDTSNQTGYFNGNANWWNQVPAPQAAQSTPAPVPSTSGNPNTYYQNKLAEAERTGNKGLATWVRAQMKGGG